MSFVHLVVRRVTMISLALSPCKHVLGASINAIIIPTSVRKIFTTNFDTTSPVIITTSFVASLVAGAGDNQENFLTDSERHSSATLQKKDYGIDDYELGNLFDMEDLDEDWASERSLAESGGVGDYGGEVIEFTKSEAKEKTKV